MTWKHRLSEIDTDSMTANCQHCGPAVRIQNADRIRCWSGRQKGGTYGNIELSYEEKVQLFGGQDKCPICLRPLTYFDSHLDHDHVTGELRGFICSSCNTSIGKLGDTVESLERALRYLKNPPLKES